MHSSQITSFNVIYFIVALIVSPSFEQSGEPVMDLKMTEQNQKQLTIGNIYESLPSDWKSRDLTYISDNKIFRVERNGEVRVLPSLDLETMCSQYSKCCDVSTPCMLTARVLVNKGTNSYLGNVLLRVTLEDKNDNKPFFESKTQTVFLSEKDPVDTVRPLTAAYDEDVMSTNRIRSYTLKGAPDVFAIDIVSLQEGRINLRLKAPLDYEKTKAYKVVLEACDPDSCAEQDINVQVKDENDNIPVFLKGVYEKNLKEDVPVESVVQTVQAEDADSGELGKVVYDIVRTRDIDLKNTFRVNRNTGEIVLKKKLSASIRANYQFIVQAKNPNENSFRKKPNSTIVKFTIEDLNDNKPEISILSPKGKIEMAENSDPKQIAMISVEDKDLGVNKIVKCYLLRSPTNTFRLDSQGNGVYALHTIRRFDYEEETSVVATIECRDQGSPPLSSKRDITLLIADVNEFTPKFDRPVYNTSIREHTRAGTELLQTFALDRDGSAKLLYSLGKQDQSYFNIDPMSGIIRTTDVQLDRELVEHVTFNVYVVDSPMNSRTATATIKVRVVDINDNAPKFISDTYFQVMENVGVPTTLNSRLEARDADSDKQVKFSLKNTWSKGQSLSGYFQVTPDGIIQTAHAMDREDYDIFTLEVEARDQGTPQRATRVNITVSVLDENDHVPVWTYPHGLDSVINISVSLPVGKVVATVRARDEDAGDNGKVRFLLLDMANGFFRINATTGHLVVAKELTPGIVRLKLRAQDMSREMSYTDTRLVIDIQGGGVTLNTTVIVIMIAVTAVISLFLVVAIICVRRSPWSGNSASPPASEVAKDHLAAAWAYHHEEQPIPDNGSVIYIPASHGMSPDNTLSMHTFGRAGGERLMPVNSMGQYDVSSTEVLVFS